MFLQTLRLLLCSLDSEKESYQELDAVCLYKVTALFTFELLGEGDRPASDHCLAWLHQSITHFSQGLDWSTEWRRTAGVFTVQSDPGAVLLLHCRGCDDIYFFLCTCHKVKNVESITFSLGAVQRKNAHNSNRCVRDRNLLTDFRDSDVGDFSVKIEYKYVNAGISL